jgi:hypothetical protein
LYALRLAQIEHNRSVQQLENGEDANLFKFDKIMTPSSRGVARENFSKIDRVVTDAQHHININK